MTTQADQDLTEENSVRNNTKEEASSKQVNNDTAQLAASTMIPDAQRTTPHQPKSPMITDDGLIIPKKLYNPVVDNAERQNLHKELLFNQKIGKNVLNQKSELQKALEKHKTNVARKEMENHMNSKTPELEKVIALVKKQQDTTAHSEDDKSLSVEFLQARAKLRTRADSK